MDDQVDKTAPRDEHAQYTELLRQNSELRGHLQALNQELDAILVRKGQKVLNKSSMNVSTPSIQSAESVRKEIEGLRRHNAQLRKEIHRMDGNDRLHELQNIIKEREKVVLSLKEENRGLENVQRNQAKQLQELDHLEGDMRSAKARHLDDVRLMKMKARQVRQERDETERQAKIQQLKLTALQERIKAAQQLQVSKENVALLREEIEEKQLENQLLESRIRELAESTEAEKAKSRSIARTAQKEAKELREELDRLQILLLEKEKEMKHSYEPRVIAKGIGVPKS